MSEKDNSPVHVTGEERRHPAIRQLARACIALARLRLQKDADVEASGAPVIDVGGQTPGSTMGGLHNE